MSDLDKPVALGPEDGLVSGAGHQATTPSSRLASMFGGKGVRVGPRIAPVAEYLKGESSGSELETADDILNRQIAGEAGNAIQYRTCSWKKTACLLFSEYIVLSIMGFPWNYSVLGLGPALVVTLVVAAIVLYTSLVLWEFCLRHPEVRDISDIGQMLFWGKRWAWWATAVMFVLNNTFIQALHILVGAVYLNTMTESDYIAGCRTVAFAVVVTALSFLGSVPRTFNVMSHLAFWSAAFTFVSILLGTIFAGIQDHPAKYDPATTGEPIFRAGPPPTTTFVLGLTAVLNISYTFIGQLTLPSFIAEMRDPRDFPKALWACTMAEIVLFCIVGSVIYTQVGEQYITAPAFGALEDVYKKVSYSFMIPTIIFVGCLYASVTARFILFRWFKDSKHLSEHTWVGWLSWLGILVGSWALAFIIAEVIPIFNSLLSLMGSIFNCWFGFIFWGVAYFRMRSADRKIGRHRGPILDSISVVANIFIIACGIFFLGCGTYASVQGIIDSYAAGTVKGVFSCESNGL